MDKALAQDLAIRPLTVVDQVVARLRVAIMVGEFSPGQRLPEAALARRMNISRPTLREAMRCLEGERLIESAPNRGPSVARLGVEQVEQIHEVWGMLTSHAAARFAALATAADIARLTELAARLESLPAVSADPLDQLAAANEFFRVILDGCGNPVLVEVTVGLLSRINVLRVRAILEGARHAATVREFRAIVAALKKHDGARAARATRAHIDAACAAAKDVLGRRS
jgi:DNA-binding GntR family transcriptional regulator